MEYSNTISEGKLGEQRQVEISRRKLEEYEVQSIDSE
jgi:hypothetical protein